MSKRLPDPVAAVKAEAAQAASGQVRLPGIVIKGAGVWLVDAMGRPKPATFCHGLLVEGELTVIFASTNVGKSVFATQLAEELAHYGRVLYIDCELSDAQWEARYADREAGIYHRFPETLDRAQINLVDMDGLNIQEEMLRQIEVCASVGYKAIFVDNLTYLCNDTETGLTAGDFMMKLLRLKQKFEDRRLTIVVVAHSPKRNGKEPITANDLAGSSRLMNFFDAGIAIGRSAKDPALRYLKQVKVRTGELVYHSGNVIVYRVVKTDAWLHYEFEGYAEEGEHLRPKSAATDQEDIEEVARLHGTGLSVRQIAKELGMSSTSVHRKLEKARSQGLITPVIPSVPTVITSEVEGSPIDDLPE